jgi:pimeloyl-ACP methyl ester carboxylesterase
MYLPLPLLALRTMLLERGASPGVCRLANDAIGKVRKSVLAHRLEQVVGVDVADDAARITSPVLYLCASDDVVVGAGSVHEILALLPQTCVTTVKGPHMLLQVAPQESWSVISSFLRHCCGID